MILTPTFASLITSGTFKNLYAVLHLHLRRFDAMRQLTPDSTKPVQAFVSEIYRTAEHNDEHLPGMYRLCMPYVCSVPAPATATDTAEVSQTSPLLSPATDREVDAWPRQCNRQNNLACSAKAQKEARKAYRTVGNRPIIPRHTRQG